MDKCVTTTRRKRKEEIHVSWMDFEISLQENGIGIQLDLELKPTDSYQNSFLENIADVKA